MKWVLFIPYLITSGLCNAQDTTEANRKWEIAGYLKNVASLSFDKKFNNSIASDLLHNRINLKWKPSGKVTAVAEFRNRLFWGEEVRSTPGFARLLRNDNEKIDLQKTWLEKRSLVLHTNVERLNIEYSHAKWNARLGRQRINWGITTTWNPNDIFNTYNFLDFDYVERAGADGGKAQYIFSNSFNTEIAYAHTGKDNGSVVALKNNFNRWGYDLQLITGWYFEHVTLGTGWAGNIKNAGFKGELQYFTRGMDSASHFNVSVEGDYMFSKGWYVKAGMLFHDKGLYRSLGRWDHINLKPSPENLMPTKWNFIITTAKEITPLFLANMSVLYAWGTNLLIVLPSFKYNLAANLDLEMIWQSFFAEFDKHFEAMNHRGFLTVKWSF